MSDHVRIALKLGCYGVILFGLAPSGTAVADSLTLLERSVGRVILAER
jgi:hypothetical protein